MRPLAIDLFCGLGGWTEGFLAEGYDVAGFDIEQHVYGEDRYPGMLVLQSVLTVHGKQFKNAACIVASPPCQEYSYMAMPWTRAKQIARGLRGEGVFPEGYKGSRTIDELNALFDACFRIQREASEAAGRHIPLVVENVKGAQPWVGPARWSFGSFYLWGDVPALMPMTLRAQKFNPDGTAHPPGSWFAIADSKERGAKSTKNEGGSWFNVGSPGQQVTGCNPVHAVTRDGVKGFTPHGQPLGKNELGRRHGSKSIGAQESVGAHREDPADPLAVHRPDVLPEGGGSRMRPLIWRHMPGRQRASVGEDSLIFPLAGWVESYMVMGR